MPYVGQLRMLAPVTHLEELEKYIEECRHPRPSTVAMGKTHLRGFFDSGKIDSVISLATTAQNVLLSIPTHVNLSTPMTRKICRASSRRMIPSIKDLNVKDPKKQLIDLAWREDKADLEKIFNATEHWATTEAAVKYFFDRLDADCALADPSFRCPWISDQSYGRSDDSLVKQFTEAQSDLLRRSRSAIHKAFKSAQEHSDISERSLTSTKEFYQAEQMRMQDIHEGDRPR